MKYKKNIVLKNYYREHMRLNKKTKLKEPHVH